MSTPDAVEAIVVGGGVAGGMAACLLAQAGVKVLLLERDEAPRHKICGEFISIEAQHYLARAGLDLAVLGAHAVTGMRLISGDVTVASPLPFIGLGLSRRTLDTALLDHAQACGAQVWRGARVLRAVHDRHFVLHVFGGGTVAAPALFLATGKHDLRGWARQPRQAPETLIGFKMHFSLAPAQGSELAPYVELMIFSAGYAGLQTVERGRVNLCLLAERGYVERAGADWPGVLAALQQESIHLRRRLAGGHALMDRPLSICRVPYGFVHRAAHEDSDHLYRLGDQAAVTPSFSGDGMAIALHSATLAVRAYLMHDGARHYHRYMRRDVLPQIRAAGVLYAMGRSGAVRRIMLATAQMWPRSPTLAARLTRLRCGPAQETPDAAR